MTQAQVIDALRLAFAVFLKADLSAEVWRQYGLALEGVNSGDLDDALADLRKSHAFHNAPLPAEILTRCDLARRRRQTVSVPAPISTTDGALQTFTGKFGSLTVRVLPDDHPALPRYACGICTDTGWEAVEPPASHQESQPWVRRCGCRAQNPVLQQHRTRNAEHARKRT